MIFPKGQTVYENLNTSFTQLDALLAELKSNQFTGYLRLTAWEYEGILLLDTGNVVNALEEARGQRRTGPAAAAAIGAKAREKDGALGVYRLSGEMALLLAGLLESELLYKDLDSAFTSLDKLIAKLQSERHTGYVEVRLAASQNAATIFMHDGETVESIFAREGAVVAGPVLEQIIQSAASQGALFTVYRADLTQTLGSGVDLSESFARQDVLTLWHDVLKTIETTVDAAAKGGTFITAFKRVCIEQAQAYPFLDPFAAEFEYHNGQIRFEGQATATQFNQGLSQCLAQTVRKLAGTPGATVVNKLPPALADLKTKYGRRLEEVGLVSALPELFGE